ncbi:hydrolase [Lithospermum erythrorhizon]|uniref:Pectinesterase n=1 Tax=Lithospermum erythrorhizon TaxID=34254 RepID=A0AAV3RQ88_LITER
MRLSTTDLYYSWVFIFLVFCSNVISRGEMVNVRGYITWDDFKIDDGHKLKLDIKLEGGNNKTGFIVVDHNGGGDSTTVQGAVDMVPVDNSQRVKIYIRPGIYREKVYVPKNKPFLSFIGDENRTLDTIITWNDKASDKDENGNEVGTYNSASVFVESNYFCATGITFENAVVATAGDTGKQAVALRVAGENAMFYRVRILGTQDTLLDQVGSHYYYQSFIQGSIDFIFGDAKSLFKDCTIHSIANMSGAIAAQHRDSPWSDTGFSFVNCTITGTGKILLGRAWGDYARITYSYCNIDDIITPQGWNDWHQPLRQRTAMVGEYMCKGKGADRRYRVPWSKALTYLEARNFLGIKFIEGESWLRL